MTSSDQYYGGTDAPLSPAQLKGGQPNVTGGERWLSILAGGSLAAVGARRGGLVGALALLGGSALVARGVAAQDPVRRLFSPSPAERHIAEQRGWDTAATGGYKVSINRPAAEIHSFLLTLSNFPRFMENLHSVEDLGDGRSRWTVDAGEGETLSYVSHLTQAEAGHGFSWESEPDAEFQTVGTVTIVERAAGRGTDVGMTVAYEPKHGQVGRIIAKLRRRETAISARKNLKRLKMLLETGEIATARINPTADNAA